MSLGCCRLPLQFVGITAGSDTASEDSTAGPIAGISYPDHEGETDSNCAAKYFSGDTGGTTWATRYSQAEDDGDAVVFYDTPFPAPPAEPPSQSGAGRWVSTFANLQADFGEERQIFREGKLKIIGPMWGSFTTHIDCVWNAGPGEWTIASPDSTTAVDINTGETAEAILTAPGVEDQQDYLFFWPHAALLDISFPFDDTPGNLLWLPSYA